VLTNGCLAKTEENARGHFLPDWQTSKSKLSEHSTTVNLAKIAIDYITYVVPYPRTSAGKPATPP
jgi:hypothetical protein